MSTIAAILFLLLLAAALAAWMVIAIRRSPYTPWQSFLYFVCVLLTRILWRAKSPGSLPLPPQQGAVIVANHRSSVDPFFVQLAARRVVHWMVAREYCEHPVFGPLLAPLQVIPVGRGGVDTAATKGAIRLVKQGSLVGMFPEGRINTSDDLLLPARPGAVLVALKARATLLPCYIDGAPYAGSPASPFYTAARVRVVFGEPIDLTPYFGREREPGVLQEITKRSMREIARLAGRDDYEPQLAGRRWNNAAATAESVGST